MILTAAKLRRATKIQQKARLIRHLNARNIRYFLDKDGWPYTTEEAMTRALVAEKRTRPNKAPYEDPRTAEKARPVLAGQAS